MSTTSRVGVRGLASGALGAGEERVVSLERLPALQVRPGAPYVTRMRVSVQDKNGAVLAELTVNESTFLTAIRKLFEEEIQKGFKRLADQTRAQARAGPVPGQGAGQARARAPVAPPATGQSTGKIVGLDVKEWARLGLAVVGEDLPDSLRLILGAALNGGVVPKP